MLPIGDVEDIIEPSALLAQYILRASTVARIFPNVSEQNEKEAQEEFSEQCSNDFKQVFNVYEQWLDRLKRVGEAQLGVSTEAGTVGTFYVFGNQTYIADVGGKVDQKVTTLAKQCGVHKPKMVVQQIGDLWFLSLNIMPSKITTQRAQDTLQIFGGLLRDSTTPTGGDIKAFERQPVYLSQRLPPMADEGVKQIFEPYPIPLVKDHASRRIEILDVSSSSEDRKNFTKAIHAEILQDPVLRANGKVQFTITAYEGPLLNIGDLVKKECKVDMSTLSLSDNVVTKDTEQPTNMDDIDMLSNPDSESAEKKEAKIDGIDDDTDMKSEHGEEAKVEVKLDSRAAAVNCLDNVTTTNLEAAVSQPVVAVCVVFTAASDDVLDPLMEPLLKVAQENAAKYNMAGADLDDVARPQIIAPQPQLFPSMKSLADRPLKQKKKKAVEKAIEELEKEDVHDCIGLFDDMHNPFDDDDENIGYPDFCGIGVIDTETEPVEANRPFRIKRQDMRDAFMANR